MSFLRTRTNNLREHQTPHSFGVKFPPTRHLPHHWVGTVRGGPSGVPECRVMELDLKLTNGNCPQILAPSVPATVCRANMEQRLTTQEKQRHSQLCIIDEGAQSECLLVPSSHSSDVGLEHSERKKRPTRRMPSIQTPKPCFAVVSGCEATCLKILVFKVSFSRASGALA